MTASAADHDPAPSSPAPRRSKPAILGPSPVDAVCPYLAASGGAWRAAQASREQRCQAVEPAVVLAIAKQRSLCLTSGHRSCATFLAARDGAAAFAARSGNTSADLWPVVRTAPLLLEPAHVRLGPLAVAPSRAGAQWLLAGLMIAALLVLVLARIVAPPIDGQAPSGPTATQPGGLGGASASPRGTSIPSASASDGVVSPSSVLPESPTPPPAAPTPVPATPAVTAAPSIATTSYTVREGDTLSSIASRFGTTVSVLASINGITDPALIRIGQVLRVPAS